MYPECIIGFFRSIFRLMLLWELYVESKIIEKHFTVDKNLEGPDHWFIWILLDMKILLQN